MEVTVRKNWIKIGILISFLGMIAVNALANILPINGMNTGVISARYDSLFTPAAYAFSIWGLIYLMLAVYVVFQLLPARGETDPARQEIVEEVGKWFIISSVLNMSWIFAWHYEQLLLSVLIMLLLLLSLIRISWTLRQPHCSPREELALRIPFGLYFGWITVATIANITAWLAGSGWNGFGLSPSVWMVAVLLVGLAIACVTMYRIRSVAYGLTVLWAYTAILVRHLSASGFGGQYRLIIVTTIISMACLLAMLVVTAVHMRKVSACDIKP